MTTTPTPHPLLDELRERRSVLARRLSETVLEIQRIKDSVLPPLFAEYDTHFRALEIELQKATLTASELGRREELFRTKLERGEVLSVRMIEVVNAIVDKEFERMKRRLREAFDMTSKEREEQATKRNLAYNEGEFAKMYRSIVKKLHPDKQPSPQDIHTISTEKFTENSSKKSGEKNADKSQLFEQFWHSAQDAYQRKDMRDLQTIYDVIFAKEEQEGTSTMFPTEEVLQREITRLEGRLRVEERKLRDLTTSEPYTLRDLMKSQTWCKSECQKLTEKIREKQLEAKRSDEFLRTIHANIGLDWQSMTKSKEQQKDDEFRNDFMENTYFNFR